MAKDDMFKIIYVILKELYETQKAGEKIDLLSISPERFKINDGYYASILREISEMELIRGIIIRTTKTGIAIGSLEDMEITFKGVEFLHENSMMKKVVEALKTVKDIAPGI